MSKSEARRFRRVKIDLPAHIVINDTDEFDGRLLNMSPGDLALQAETNAAEGDAAIVRIKGLDIIEGKVARTFPDGFALSFLLSKKRRALLTEKLMFYANKGFSDGLGDRRDSLRHRNAATRTVCRLPDGASLFVKILDLSVDGVSVDAPRRPPVGSTIYVGRLRGVIVRHTPRGFVVAYDMHAPNMAQPSLRAV